MSKHVYLESLRAVDWDVTRTCVQILWAWLQAENQTQND